MDPLPPDRPGSRPGDPRAPREAGPPIVPRPTQDPKEAADHPLGPAIPSPSRKEGVGDETVEAWTKGATSRSRMSPSETVEKVLPARGLDLPTGERGQEDAARDLELTTRVVNENISIPEMAAIANEFGIPRNMVSHEFAQMGVKPEKIEELMQHQHLLLPELTEAEKVNVSDPVTEEVIQAGKTNAEKELEAGIFEDVKKRFETEAEPQEGDLEKIATVRKGFNKFLFDENEGILRREGRKARLFGKPLVVGLMATFLAYLSLLSLMTKWAAKRVGS